MKCYISFRDVTFTPTTSGVRIVVETDVPCHLFCRLTLQEPWIHKKPVLRRGTWLNDDVRFCFTVFEDNEQFEHGDTLFHTFWKPDWPVCTTKYLYFWGQVGATVCESTSPIFSYHNDGVSPIPAPDRLFTYNPVDPERLATSVANAWQTFDLSNYIDENATGVILYWGFHQNIGTVNFRIRMNGQTFTHGGAVITPSQGCAVIGVDSAKKIQIWTGSTLNLFVYVIGFTGRNVYFFDEPLDISPILDQTWMTQPLALYAPNANAIIGHSANYAPALGFRSDVRPNGSTDNYIWGLQQTWWTIGCDATQKIQTYVWLAGATQKHYALGYIIDSPTFDVNRRVVPDPLVGAWTPYRVQSLATVPKFGIVHIIDEGPIVGKSGVKKEYGYFDPYENSYSQSYWIAHCLPDGDIEIIREKVGIHFYVCGETE